MKQFNDIRDWLNADFCEAEGIEEDRIQELYDYARLLDKALDKACEELDDRYYCHKGIRIACDDENCKMCIKEYLLKESEKQ